MKKASVAACVFRTIILMIRFSDELPQEYDEIVEAIQTRTLRSKLCLSFEANVENAYDPNC
jgi:hypothetical protein